MTAPKPVEGMSVTTVRDNYRVEVEVTQGATYGTPEDNHRRRWNELSDVAGLIRRNVDGIQSISCMWDTKLVCGHCNYPIEDGYAGQEPQCCAAAQAEYVALGHELSD